MSEENFRALFSDLRIHSIFISVTQNEKNHWVGYYISRVYMLTYSGNVPAQNDSYALFRDQAILLPEYRGHHHKGQNISIIAFQKIKKYIHGLFPKANIISFAPLIRPESLILLSKQGKISYPSPLYQTPQRIESFMHYLRDFLEFLPEKSSPYAIKYPYITRLSEKEKQTFEISLDPFVKYFREITKFQDGVAMIGISFHYLTPNNSLELPPIGPKTKAEIDFFGSHHISFLPTQQIKLRAKM